MGDKEKNNMLISSVLTYARLLGEVKAYWKLFAISVFGFIVYAAGQPALAWVFKYFVDGLISPASDKFFNIPVLYGFPLLIVFIALMQGVGAFLGNYFMSQVSLIVIYNLRKKIFTHLIALPIEYFDQHKTGFLISRVTHNVNSVTGAATESLKILFREGLTVIALLGYLIWMNWKLTLVILVTLPIIGLLTKRVNRKFRRLSKEMLDAMGDITHVVSEVVTSNRIVRGFCREDYEIKRFDDVNKASFKRNLKMNKMGASFTPVIQLVTYVALAVIMFLVLYFRGNSSPGDLVAYVTAVCLLPKPIRQLSELSVIIQRGITGAENIFDFLDQPIENNDGNISPSTLTGKIEFRNLSFTYPNANKEALKNVSFTINPGETVALVGHSGSGKSTLANLIPRFYRYTKGKVLIDEVDINDFTLESLRKNIALVTQEVILFNDTIYNNIAYSNPTGATKDEILKAASLSNANEFIDKLADGLETQIGTNGVLLSGGQRQRLSIARALLKNAPILILDEATSSLDNESEKLIQQAVENVTSSRTTLIIAHRLSTIERADLIVVMKDGEIVETGQHSDLIKSNGHYAKLYSMGISEGAI
ncbi:MAG: lipid A export permease/ATP-binding protein MsbA [Methylotenera sp.]|uniref:lipid A export permease/ATP-binding protein MsbA n=1 Tax=Methylotenera sp. TaxID=2051956 RepID=UPI00272518AD|nr:lipid A export permease/ATP-binding protein MsbA [Methylotenera sp.]MDO9150518.1 lipid A export permease/ATP-binding protein MsbA [Methylotenera sp.]